MKSLTFVAIILFFIALAGTYVYNVGQASAGEKLFEFRPVYSYVPGEVLSTFNAFFFVFIASLLLFGLGAILSMLLEGAKYGYLLSVLFTGGSTAFHVFDLLFVVPQIMACIAATTLGAGLILDYRGKSSLFPYWNYGVRYFLFALLITLVLLGMRPFMVSL
ncbi:hypothetical protein HY571_02605 [Candidatus Micrarchaeota archaeon]|nr:hypothetical protein [Candidatus Micrarchaeota archaeon]